MSITESIYKWRTFVPVRFQRAVHGEPQIDAPDLDDRGHRDNEHGPIVGIMAGQTVRVAVRRAELDPSADLWLTSTDPSVVTIEQPAGGRLPSGDRVEIQLRGVAPSGAIGIGRAQIEVRFGFSGGPILGVLHVWVCSELPVDVTPHLVVIRSSAWKKVGSVADPEAIMRMVQAIWRPCGITFRVLATVHDEVTFAAAGEVQAPKFPGSGYKGTELATLFNTNWKADSINVYFVNQIRAKDSPLGLGFSPEKALKDKLPHPGIVLADTNGMTDHDLHWWANDLAHEIGHFFKLKHAGDLEVPQQLRDCWARRMLMSNLNLQFSPTAAVEFQANVGYGQPSPGMSFYRGSLVTMKRVIDPDAECLLARSQMARGRTPYQ